MKRSIVATLCGAAFAVAHAESGSYSIDPTHTFVRFEVLHLGTSTVRARFDKTRGQITLDKSGQTGRAEITIDMGSIDSGVAPFDKRLQGPDFFDVQTYPSATFVGDRFVFSDDRLSQVDGRLTLRGQTHPVSLKATRFNCYTSPLFKREVCGGDFETTIARSRWGLGDGLPAIAPDSVHLLVQVEAIKQ